MNKYKNTLVSSWILTSRQAYWVPSGNQEPPSDERGRRLLSGLKRKNASELMTVVRPEKVPEMCDLK